MRISAALSIFALLAVCGMVHALPTQPKNPVVGIFTAPSLSGSCTMLSEDLQKKHQKGQQAKRVVDSIGDHDEQSTGCIWSIYVDWLESSAIRVVPIPWNATMNETRFLLDRVNGVLFPGGVLSRSSALYTTYLNRMCDVYDDVVGRNAIGDKLSLWGTCEGFQMINVCAAGRNVSVLNDNYHQMDPTMLALNLTSFAPSSAMFGGMSSDMLQSVTKEKLTLNWHHLGVAPDQYIVNPILNQSGMVPLATTNDPLGNVFVSAAESTVAQIYAVQFHPERVMFQFHDGIEHPPAGIQLSEYLSLMFMEKIQACNHSFESPQEAETYMIANYPVTNMGWGVRIYFV